MFSSARLSGTAAVLTGTFRTERDGPHASGLPTSSQANIRPVVAILVVDGLRPDLIDPTTTPTLWRLQREGSVYTDSHSAFPSVTRVNGASLATGAYPARHGVVGNTMYVPALSPTPLSAGEWQNLARMGDASPGGRLLTVQ